MISDGRGLDGMLCMVINAQGYDQADCGRGSSLGNPEYLLEEWRLAPSRFG